MPIFISYSHNDARFVDQLAQNLVAERHNVWLDRWELGVGDSLTQRIQAALTDAGAMIVVLSKSSVQSDWCKRELTAGLVRELEEKQTIVMPCVIDDCNIPLFLRDKLYADFRRDPDGAMDLVKRSLARITNPFQGRIENPKFHTDWSVVWAEAGDGEWFFRWTFIDHGHDWPYVILSECKVFCDEAASEAFATAHNAGNAEGFIRSVLEALVKKLDTKPLSEVIDDHHEKFVSWKLRHPKGHTFTVVYTYRRLGADNGMSTLVHLDNNLRMALKHVTSATAKPKRNRSA